MFYRHKKNSKINNTNMGWGVNKYDKQQFKLKKRDHFFPTSTNMF